MPALPPPLTMSQTKEELLRHLNLPPATYALMAKETHGVYMWLTSEKSHLKKNCKRNPPYDWSDIKEKYKDEAMALIARGGDTHTSYYWKLAVPSEGCPNWIARWFLYHKFRYRDGRNKSTGKGNAADASIHSTHHEDRRPGRDSSSSIGGEGEAGYGTYSHSPGGSVAAGSSSMCGYAASSSYSSTPNQPPGSPYSYQSSGNAYVFALASASTTNGAACAVPSGGRRAGVSSAQTFYDPVRDAAHHGGGMLE